MSRFEDNIQQVRQKRVADEAKETERRNQQEKAMRASEQDRKHFLSACHAAPLPMHMYALWLLVYVENGGKVTHSSSHNYGSGHGYFMPNPLPITSSEVAFIHPTAPNGKAMRIPAGFGALKFDMLILPDLPPDISLKPIPHEYNNYGSRKGWEWGHTTIMTLSPKDKSWLSAEYGSWEATTNQPDSVASFPDIEALILNKKECKIALRTLGDRIKNFDAIKRSQHQLGPENEHREDFPPQPMIE